MASVARVTGTGTFLTQAGGTGTDGLIAARGGAIRSVVCNGTGGDGTVTLHDTNSGTGSGVIVTVDVTGTEPVTINGGPDGIMFGTGLRVVQAGTTGLLQTIIVYD